MPGPDDVAAADLTFRTVRALADRGLTLATAESLTGGGLTAELTRVPGASAGLNIAARLGLSPEIIAAAREQMTTQTADIGAFLDQPTGVVRVAAFQSAAQMLLPGLLSRLADHPEVIVECSDEDVAQDAFVHLTSEFDVVIAHRADRGQEWAGAVDGRVLVVPLLREPLDVALPPQHRLAERVSVTPQDLADEEWITVRAGFPVAAVLEAVTAGSGTGPRVRHRINDFHVAEALVAAGHGISLLPRFTADDRGGTRFRLVPLVGVRAGRQIDALVRPDRAERRVVRLVLEALRSHASAVAA